jgi:hypothetical protein
MPIYPTKTVDYNFDNPACYNGSGTTVTDLQGNLNLNFVGTPTFTSSAGNGSYFSFTAATVVANHLASAFDATFNGSFNFSYSFCIRPQNLVAVSGLYGGLNSSNLNSENTARISQIDSSGNIWSSAVGYAGENITPTSIVLNQWVVVTVTSDYTNNQLKTYINGTLVKTDAFSTTYSFINPQVILGFMNSSPYFDTSLADSDIKAFSIWKNVVLTGPQAQDVADDFIQYTTPVDLLIDIQYPASFTDGGTALNDLSGNGKDFTLSSTSYTFDPSVDSLLLPLGTSATGDNTEFAYGVQAFTILSWVKLNTYAGSANIFLLGPDGSGTRLFYNIDSTAGTFSSDNGGSVASFAPFTFDSDWHLLALTRPVSGIVSDQRYYVDGVEIPTSGLYNGGTTLNQGSGGYALIHSSFAPQPLTFASLRIYLAEFDSTQITAIYNAEVSRFAPPVPPAYAGNVGGRQFAQGFNG